MTRPRMQLDFTDSRSRTTRTGGAGVTTTASWSTTSQSSSSSSRTIIFPRRSPRIGPSYQHKVKRYNPQQQQQHPYETLRSKPIPMSMTNPHRTVCEMGEQQEEQHDDDDDHDRKDVDDNKITETARPGERKRSPSSLSYSSSLLSLSSLTGYEQLGKNHHAVVNNRRRTGGTLISPKQQQQQHEETNNRDHEHNDKNKARVTTTRKKKSITISIKNNKSSSNFDPAACPKRRGRKRKDKDDDDHNNTDHHAVITKSNNRMTHQSDDDDDDHRRWVRSVLAWNRSHRSIKCSNSRTRESAATADVSHNKLSKSSQSTVTATAILPSLAAEVATDATTTTNITTTSTTAGRRAKSTRPRKRPRGLCDDSVVVTSMAGVSSNRSSNMNHTSNKTNVNREDRGSEALALLPPPSKLTKYAGTGMVFPTTTTAKTPPSQRPICTTQSLSKTGSEEKEETAPAPAKELCEVWAYYKSQRHDHQLSQASFGCLIDWSAGRNRYAMKAEDGRVRREKQKLQHQRQRRQDLLFSPATTTTACNAETSSLSSTPIAGQGVASANGNDEYHLDTKPPSTHTSESSTELTSSSWRQMHMRPVSVLGDYRSGYDYGQRRQQADQSQSPLSKEEAREVWMAVLACARHIREQTITTTSRRTGGTNNTASTPGTGGTATSNSGYSPASLLSLSKQQSSQLFSSSSTKHSPYTLSQLVSFVGHACRLPTPEEVFQKREQDGSQQHAHSLQSSSHDANNIVVVNQINECMGAVVDVIQEVRQVRADLLDFWYTPSSGMVAAGGGLAVGNGTNASSTTGSAAVGVDVEVARKHLDNAQKRCHPIMIDEVPELHRQIVVMQVWQQKLEVALMPQPTTSMTSGALSSSSSTSSSALSKGLHTSSHSVAYQGNSDPDSDERDDLKVLEQLKREGQTHGLLTKGMIQLEAKLDKAHQLRDRILEWLDSATGIDNDDGSYTAAFEIENSATAPDSALSATKVVRRKETIKFIAAMVREIHRLKLTFPAATALLDFHQKAECWVDRANIAIRSRLSLTEIRQLLQRGQELPLDVSEYAEKLASRIHQAEDWLERFQSAVPPPPSYSNTATVASSTSLATPAVDFSLDRDGPLMLEWMQRMRQELDSRHAQLHDLASEGSRIPVEIDCVKLLQIELDARSWSAKARKWIPQATSSQSSAGGCEPTASGGDGGSSEGDNAGVHSKRGKLEDLREHIDRATGFRDRLILSDDLKAGWVLDGEKELVSIVEAADRWLEKYKVYLEDDRRKTGHHGNRTVAGTASSSPSTARSHISIALLRQIVSEGNAIYVNTGNATLKIAKILAQAERWYQKYCPLLVRCRLVEPPMQGADSPSKPSSPPKSVTLSELSAAVDSAKSSLSWDLVEAMQLRKLVERIREWNNRVSVAIGPGKQRRGKKMPNYSIEDLQGLIEESLSFPVDASEEVKRLEEKLRRATDWRSMATQSLEGIVTGFRSLKDALLDRYGLPSKFCRDRSCKADLPVSALPTSAESQVDNVAEEKKSAEDASQSTSSSDSDLGSALINFGGDDCNVYMLIKTFCDGTKTSCVATAERQTASQLESVSRWCMKSLKYLDDPKDVFDKRFFGAFDRFVEEGRKLRKVADEPTPGEERDNGEGLLRRLKTSWGSVVADQLERLSVLLSDRKRFTDWCRCAEQLLSADEKRPTMEKLNDLATKSHDFPANGEVVQKIRGLANKVAGWVDRARKALAPEVKMTLYDAKAILDQGEKLGFQCMELRTFRNGLKAARSWANRVKRSKLEQGGTHMKDVKALMAEHDNLIVEMPDEVAKLRQAMKNYCICRRPYEGFMIGCDECEEWFHGPCIGVSASRADRFDKYVCVRCLLSKTFKSSTSLIVAIIRKWTSEKERKKARQVESQKHQRKVRKEVKDIKKIRDEETKIKTQLEQQHAGAQIDSAPSCLVGSSIVAGSSLASSPVHAESQLMAQSVDPVTGSPAAPIDGAKQSGTLPTEFVDAEKLRLRLQQQSESIQQCEARLEELNVALEERKRVHAFEDANSSLLRTWCVRVRSLLVAPLTVEQAAKSRPRDDGSLSEAMICLINDADRFGLRELSDVREVINLFKCICWSMRSMAVLSRQPALADVSSLISRAASIQLPDEKALRMMKSMCQRATSWSTKVTKALAPCPGEVKPFDLDSLKELAHTGDDIPLCMPLEPRLLTVIEDNGSRHCHCGGPSDGRFMLSCDHCNRWFHGHCVGVTKEASDFLPEWKCRPCNGNSVDVTLLDAKNFHNKFDVEIDPTLINEDDDDVSSKAPKPSWPPYGLFGSLEAQEALGSECCAIPQNTEEWLPTRSGAANGVQPAIDRGCNLATLSEVASMANVRSSTSLATSVAAVGNQHVGATVRVGVPAGTLGTVAHAESMKIGAAVPSRIGYNILSGAAEQSTREEDLLSTAHPFSGQRIVTQQPQQKTQACLDPVIISSSSSDIILTDRPPGASNPSEGTYPKALIVAAIKEGYD